MALFSKTKKETNGKDASAPRASRVKAVSSARSLAPEKKKAVKAVKPEKGVTAGYATVLRAPSITEKSLKATEQGVYVFFVDPRTTKQEVAKAVKAVYNVDAVKVNMVHVSARATVSRMRRRQGVSSGYKKAFVYLKKGEKITLT